MTDQLNLWKSTFGQDYTVRNDVAKPERIVAWRRLLDGITVARAVEVGCNVGWNLQYLKELGVDERYGVEPQRSAVEDVLCGTAFDLPFKDGFADLAFTSGVLIHIAPADLGRAMDELYRVSRRYVVAIEYDDPVEQEISYRGHAGALWKRDHGAIWQARYPSLNLLRRFTLHAGDGYDDCTAHLFEKPGA
jgi:pseudaminic acid biosynthesis-associated methylase